MIVYLFNIYCLLLKTTTFTVPRSIVELGGFYDIRHCKDPSLAVC